VIPLLITIPCLTPAQVSDLILKSWKCLRAHALLHPSPQRTWCLALSQLRRLYLDDAPAIVLAKR
jgi:hypothetical protein